MLRGVGAGLEWIRVGYVGEGSLGYVGEGAGRF